MALDAVGLEMVAKRVRGAAILCLGYPDITARPEMVASLLGVKPRKFTDHGKDHKIAWPLPETVDTLMLAGAVAVDCVDIVQSRGVERVVDLNHRTPWERAYDLVINPGTIEHCFGVAAAMFNAWTAVRLGGVILHVAPMSMLNHGFWNMSPTLFGDFAQANGGEVLQMRARDREWRDVPVQATGRFKAPSESVLYALVKKVAEVPEAIPVQARYRR